MSTKRRISICADDFALDERVSVAALTLAAKGHISAVSCFADSPLWQEAGAELNRLRHNVLIGLHLNLTQSFGAPVPGLHRTILLALTRRLDVADVRARLTRQIERFVRIIGEPPDFIDGHEHVHSFPVISGIVRDIADKIGPRTPVRSLRKFFGPTDAPIKRAVIRGLSALGERDARDIRQNSLNTGFAGDYSLNASADFSALFQTWLRKAPDRALIMCHPRIGLANKRPTAGANEFRFLESAAFANLLERQRDLAFLRRSDLAEGNRLELPSNELRESPATGRPLSQPSGEKTWSSR